MKFDLKSALKYPYQHYVDCILWPGVVVYVDILLTILFFIVLIFLVIMVLAATGMDFS